MKVQACVYRGVLLALFAASGCSALIYEIVWYQLLQLAIGSTAVSLGILLATFMGGLCIGSLAFPRLFPKLGSLGAYPLRLYAVLEAGIAIFGLAALLLIPAIEGLYVEGVQHGLPGMLLRGLMCVLCLLPPTILMGASLPAIARRAEGAPDSPAWWSLLYGANTLGAVSGALLAGFWLLRFYDITLATIIAAAINILAAIIAYALATRGQPEPVSQAPAAPQDYRAHLAIALSGAAALGSQVVWARLMGLMLGATVYAFSIILAVFLTGLAIGSAVGSSLVRRLEPRAALGWAQLLAALGIAWTAYMLADVLPWWPINPGLATHARFIFQLDLVRCVVALLPACLCWGASFPLAFAAVRARAPERVVGGIYAANTFGAIFGALAVSLVLVAWIGTQNTQRVLMAVSVMGGLVMLVPLAWRTSLGVAGLGAALALLAVLGLRIDPVPGELIAYGRRMPTYIGQSTILYTAEGRDSSIAISRWTADNTLQFHVAGKVEASTAGIDMYLQRMLGHIAALAHPAPRSVLIVGFGAGVTAGSFTRYPGIRSITICEMEPLIPPTTTRYFPLQNYSVATDPRTRITYDDARHFVLTTPDKYDVITSDPIHPFVRGSAALYSKEYFESVKAHLTENGTVTQWLPLYESDETTVKSAMATFFAVFPGAMVFANTNRGKGYDLALLGQKNPRPLDIDALTQRMNGPSNYAARRSLADVGFPNATSLFATYIGGEKDLKDWLAGGQINRDSNLRLQYLAGLALNQSREDEIYRSILSHRKLPSADFTGSTSALDNLFEAMRVRGTPMYED